MAGTGEKQSLTAAMDREDTARNEDGPKGIWKAMASGRVWYFTIIYFCLQVAVYGTTFYLPQQVSSLLGQDVGWQVGLVAAIPWLVGLVACYLVGSKADTVVVAVAGGRCSTSPPVCRSSGRHGRVRTASRSSASCSSPSPSRASWRSARSPGPTRRRSSPVAAAAAGIGLINSLGNLGGFVAPIMRTAINEAVPTDSGAFGIVSLGILAFVAAVMIFCTKFFRGAKADALLDTSHVATTSTKGTTR